MPSARQICAALALVLPLAATAFLALPQDARADHDNIARRCDWRGCAVIHCNYTGDRCFRLDRRYGYGYGYGYRRHDYDRYGGYDYDRYDYDRNYRRHYYDERVYRDDDYGDYRYRDGYVYRDRGDYRGYRDDDPYDD